MCLVPMPLTVAVSQFKTLKERRSYFSLWSVLLLLLFCCLLLLLLLFVVVFVPEGGLFFQVNSTSAFGATTTLPAALLSGASAAWPSFLSFFLSFDNSAIDDYFVSVCPLRLFFYISRWTTFN